MQQQQQQEQQIKQQFNEDKQRAYRLAQEKFFLKIQDENEDLEDVVPLNNYLIFTYFDTGVIRIIDASKQGKILNGDKGTPVPHNNDFDLQSYDLIKNIFVYDDERVCFINTSLKKLQWFNYITFEFEELFSAPVPTQQAMKDTSNQESLFDLIRDGTSISYLQESQSIVVQEVLSSYNPNDNNVVLTCFKSGDKNNQVIFQNNVQKNLFLSKVNNQDKVAIWSQTFNDVEISFNIWDITSDSIKLITLSENIDGNVLEIHPWKENQMALFTNLNKSNYPQLKIFDYTQQSPIQEQTIDLNLFGDGDSNAWCMTDFFSCDYKEEKIIWERKGEKGTFMDVYNPQHHDITFSLEVEQDQMEEDTEYYDIYEPNLNKIISPNGKYIIGFNEDVQSDDYGCKNYPFFIFSIVSQGATIVNILKLTNLFDKYGENFTKEITDIIFKKQE